MYGCSQQPHFIYIQCLTLGVLFSHEHLTFHTHEGCCRGSCHTVLSGTGLCDDSGLAHLLCQQHLSQHVIDLMGTGVVEILSL